MSISEATLTRIIDAGERTDDLIRRTGARLRQPVPQANLRSMARALGWFSIGLGAAEALAPRMTARLMGAQGYEGTVRAFGLREIATGLGILADPKPSAGWLWARTWGDALDLAFIGIAASRHRGSLGRAAIAGAMVAVVSGADCYCARHLRTAS
jgi:hypothetical protein